MRAQQIVLPFRSPRSRRRKRSNLDLIGRAYRDNHVTVTVVGTCADDDRRVLVRRQPGNTGPMLAWLMHSIFEEEDKKRKRAA
jgi:hypothetical protein